jgi:tellurite resistance protein TerC
MFSDLFPHATDRQFLMAIFALFAVPLFAYDLRSAFRDIHIPTLRESAIWVGVWAALSLGFNLLIWEKLGTKPALDFLTAYLVEWSLSVDNLVVFMVIFTFFNIPVQFQRRVLIWGITAALIMRAIMIGFGSYLIGQHDWLFYIFSVILIFSAYKMAAGDDGHGDLNKKPLIRLCRRFLPLTPELHGEKFSVRINGKWMLTPMALVLVLVEAADVVFAIDSLAAVFAITLDPLIVFTSNALAVLGLRSLYFMLAGLLPKIRYLRYGLAVLLAYVGIKIALQHALGLHWPAWITLLIIFSSIGGSILVSVLNPADTAAKPAQPPAPADH